MEGSSTCPPSPGQKRGRGGGSWTSPPPSSSRDGPSSPPAPTSTCFSLLGISPPSHASRRTLNNVKNVYLSTTLYIKLTPCELTAVLPPKMLVEGRNCLRKNERISGQADRIAYILCRRPIACPHLCRQSCLLIPTRL